MATVFPFAFPTAFGDVAPAIPGPPAITFAPAVPQPSHQIVSQTQIVTLRTHSGVQLDQWIGEDQISLLWTRNRGDTSRVDTVLPSDITYTGRVPEVVPWLHWVDVFDETGRDLLWSGPITKFSANRETMSIGANDVSAYGSKTRTKLTKRWDATDPAAIAAEHWAQMIEHHNLPTKPIVRLDPLGDRFDYTSKADANMVDEVMGELGSMGLTWSVVNGTPILGPWDRTPMVALSDVDFLGEGVTITRDGTRSFNDILLLTGRAKTVARVPMGGLSLQQIVTADSISDVSNADRQARIYAAWAGKIRDGVSLPGGAILHPDAPVSIDQLIPSARFTLEAYGDLYLMELVSVEVSSGSGVNQVSVTMEAVDDDLPELVELQKGQFRGGLGGGLS